MIIKEHGSFKEAVASIIPDKEYLLIKHELNVGEEIKPHYHEKANEWIVVDNGIFVIRIGEEQERFDVDSGIVLTIFLPKATRHSLKALTEITYFVLRDEVNEQIHYSLNGY